jgi:hypothetical protein
VVYGDYQNGVSAVDFFAREYSFELHANDRKTGLLIARANCSANAHGSVISLSLIPLDEASRATFAARY